MRPQVWPAWIVAIGSVTSNAKKHWVPRSKSDGRQIDESDETPPRQRLAGAEAARAGRSGRGTTASPATGVYCQVPMNSAEVVAVAAAARRGSPQRPCRPEDEPDGEENAARLVRHGRLRLSIEPAAYTATARGALPLLARGRARGRRAARERGGRLGEDVLDEAAQRAAGRRAPRPRRPRHLGLDRRALRGDARGVEHARRGEPGAKRGIGSLRVHSAVSSGAVARRIVGACCARPGGRSPPR